MAERGKLIVVEGMEGLGQDNAINYLGNTLKQFKISSSVVKFPPLRKGPDISRLGRYFADDFGDFQELDPDLLRFLQAESMNTVNINSLLNQGYWVLAEHYIPAIKAFVGAALPAEQVEDFFMMVEELQYGKKGLPKEDLVILFNGDPEVAQRQRVYRSIEGESYPPPEDLGYQSEVAQIYLELAKREPHWAILERTKPGAMRNDLEVNQELTSILKSRKLI